MATGDRSHTRRARERWRWLAVALALGSIAPAVSAQTAAPAGDQDRDPLAWRRRDPAAADLAIAVEDRATRRTREIAGRLLLLGSQEVYVRSADAADLLQANRLWQAVSRRLALRIGSREARFTDQSRLVSLGDREILLPVPVLFADGDLWLPLGFVSDILAPEAGQYLAWDRDLRRLTTGQAEVNLTDLRVTPMTRAASLRLLCREALSFRASSPEPGVIELKIYGAQADLAQVRLDEPQGLIRGAATRQFADYAVVTVRVDELVTHYRTETASSGREIVLIVEEEQVAALPEPVPRGQAEIALGGGPVDVTRQLEIRTVVVDPGHGGTEPGVASAGGILEKDVNLAVAEELADHLRGRGLKVVLTRDDDRTLGLAERAEIANSAGGDLFVSLHCNGWFNHGARGLETYFLSPAKSDWSQSVEAVENRDQAAPGDVEFIVWDLVQNRYISASSDLAEVVQAEVCRALRVPDRGVRQAGFRVLVGAWMPAVLVEMGFLTHPDEAQDLSNRRYQRDLAHALGDAILVYRDQVARAGAAAAGEGAR
ncbi:MAG TPA: N-acetylmuramoyl-L-alanine amidase [Candidatus Krumholzibacteria bacterium]|nr:N-acetylmuramoyl-L-alanine amidase [Candidatus Krumholzibacteria bacterium]HPD71010.1 N-acetylmuramoyl-L-alanine amidase [Candidatus Krumholzibacteria bacterium]HRY39290.1 N-acetylmuramoyl-L-alanine amidase [Candidatus Krumholzibacteria bacterium]